MGSDYGLARNQALRANLRITPQISDAPMRVTQNKFMAGARSLHLLVMRLAVQRTIGADCTAVL